LTDVGADSFGWADNGKTITWALGASFFRQPVSTVTFDPEKKPTDETGEKKDEEPAQTKPAASDKTPKYEEIAVDIEAPRYKPKGVIVLQDAKIITMRGDEVIPD